jgi:hypothetical protein
MKNFKELNDFYQGEKLTMYVKGPPGSGKTCFISLWARMLRANEGKRVLMVQTRPSGTCVILILEINGDDSAKSCVPENLYSILADLFQKETFDLCIVDGVHQHIPMCMSIVALVKSEHMKTNKNVIVTLEWFLPLGEELTGAHGTVKSIAFASWTESDYDEACKSQLLVAYPAVRKMLLADWEAFVGVDPVQDTEEGAKSDSDESLTLAEEGGMHASDENSTPEAEKEMQLILRDAVANKYHYAGGSARFMFDLTMTELQDFLGEAVTRVKDWEKFARGEMAAGEPESVHSLLQKVNVRGRFRSIPVSRYIMLYAYGKARQAVSAVVQGVASATGNMALRGWAFELEQLDLIDKVFERRVQRCFSVGTQKLQFTITSLAKLSYDGSTLEGSFDTYSGYGSAFISCLKWNQGCFGIVFCIRETLYTVQFTISQIHIQLLCKRSGCSV